MELVVLITSEQDVLDLFGKIYFQDVVLDLSGINNISVEGISYLLRLGMIIERDGFKLRIINICPDIFVKFQQLKLNKFITIENL